MPFVIVKLPVRLTPTGLCIWALYPAICVLRARLVKIQACLLPAHRSFQGVEAARFSEPLLRPPFLDGSEEWFE